MAAIKMSEDLTKLIEETIRDNTFSVEAVEGIKRIKDNAALLQARNTQLETDINAMRNTNAGLAREINNIRDENERLLKADADVKAREARVFELEKNAAVAEAIGQTYEKVFDKIFANPIVRTKVTENNMRSYPPQQGMTYAPSGTDSVNRTVEEQHL